MTLEERVEQLELEVAELREALAGVEAPANPRDAAFRRLVARVRARQQKETTS